ncbi:unnamed protein product [Toxocara canis]|uniref:MBL fold metallo-hydrolase n=1 Tax=Toxocara canis TaxID=6265 RepID=A0A183UYX4_TOXCA|nr:unnamed protein product [Toxocara canis]
MRIYVYETERFECFDDHASNVYVLLVGTRTEWTIGTYAYGLND